VLALLHGPKGATIATVMRATSPTFSTHEKS
jgi:hypothetical protein